MVFVFYSTLRHFPKKFFHRIHLDKCKQVRYRKIIYLNYILIGSRTIASEENFPPLPKLYPNWGAIFLGRNCLVALQP